MGIAFAPRNSFFPGGPGDLHPDWQESLGSDAASAREAIPWVLAAICAGVLGVALWATRGISPLNSDTPSYLYFNPSRTVGYPVFLWVVRLLAGHAAAAVPVQMSLLAVSLFLLGWSFHNLVGRAKLSLAFQILLLCSPDVWRFSAELMTEALATALVALWCAQLLRLIRQPSHGGHFLLALISAGGMSIRPSLLVLFAGAAMAAFLLNSSQRRFAILLLIPAGFAAYLLTPLLLFAVRGSPVTTSPLARGVLQHTLFCDGAVAPGDADAVVVDGHSAALRQYVDSAPGDVGIALQHVYSAPLRFGSIIPALGRLHQFNAAWQTDPIVARVAAQRVKANPVCYSASVLRNYLALATQASLHIGTGGAKVDQFLASHPPVQVLPEPLLPEDSRELQQAAAELHVAPATRAPIGRFGVKSSPLLLLLGRALYGVTALIGFLALAVVARCRTGSRDRHTVALAAMGLVFHTLFLGTAVAELALIRYTVPAWPIVCTVLVVTFATLQLRNQPRVTSSIVETRASRQAAPATTLS